MYKFPDSLISSAEGAEDSVTRAPVKIELQVAPLYTWRGVHRKCTNLLSIFFE